MASVKRLEYPACPMGDAFDMLHGVRVADPFRSLEDPDGKETVAFVEAENRVTQAYFNNFKDLRRANHDRLKELQNYERVGCPFRRGEHFFVHRNSGLQNQDVLYRLPPDQLVGVHGDMFASATVLLDLNAEYPEGTTSLGSHSFSEDGSMLAYGLQSAGSDWQTLRVRDVATGKDMADVVPWTKFTSIAWTHDGLGFFYTRHPEPAIASADAAGTETAATENCMLCYHRVGTPASEDLLVLADSLHPVWRFGVEVSDDGAYIAISVYKGTDPVNRIYVAHLATVWDAWLRDHACKLDGSRANGDISADATSEARGRTGSYLPVIRLIDNFEASYDYITNQGSRFLFRTNLDAPTHRLVCVNVDTHAGTTAPSTSDGPTPAIVEVLPADAAAVLDWVAAVAGDSLICCYMRDVVNSVSVLHFGSGDTVTSPVTTLTLPDASTVVSFSGRRDQGVAFLKVVSPLLPGSILRIDMTVATPDTAKWYDIRVPGFDPTLFTTTCEFVPSIDGAAQIPLFVVRRRVPTGGVSKTHRTLLYGYGGFNVSIQPTFSALRLLWLQELDGVFALACIRGGGEYGRSWHQAGSGANKQNCFDDFHACAEHLVRTGVCTPKQLGIMGGSNGGLLVLATAQQHPEAFGAVVSQVPVTDMFRFHKFTVGALWRGEYGHVETSADEFKVMAAYSPLHNVREVTDPAKQLPATLITTADHDDRVVPLHSLKMIATLQAVAGVCPAQTNPLLVRVDVKAGHGAGKPIGKVIEEYADIYSFLAYQLPA